MRVLLSLLLSTVSASAAAAERVEWRSGPLLAPLLAATDLVPGLEVEGWDATRPVVASECSVTALRPARGEGPLRDDSNALSCTFSYAEGDGGSVTLSLADTSVWFWGNQFDRHKPFELQGAVADGLFEVLLAAQRSGVHGDLMDRIGVCGPDGHVCLEIVAMMRLSADESPAAMVCSKEYEDGLPNGIECVLHPQQ